MWNISWETSIEQLENLAPDIRLIVVHPNYVSQHLLFNTLLQQDTAVYVRFDGTNLSEAQLTSQLNVAVDRQLNSAGLSGAKYVILDECDRSGSEVFSEFLRNLLSRLGANGRILVFSRNAPSGLLKDDGLRAQMRFIPADDNLMLFDYADRQEEQALLEVRAFGSGHVYLNGQIIDNWDGTLPRALFFYLVDRGMVRRDDIFATFWPKLTVREATNVFHVTKRKISELLGMDLTVYWSGFYRISPDIQLSYDVIRFTEMVQDSAVAAEPDTSIQLLTNAISLYRSAFLNAMDLEWVVTRRGELLQMYGEALISLADLCRETGDKSRALGLYSRSLTTNLEQYDVIMNIMQLYAELEMPHEALRVYDHWVAEFSQDPSMPTQELEALAKKLRSGLG